MPTAPKEVTELVRKFELNLDSYRSPAYNEAQVRQEFINPLFELLGWDMAPRWTPREGGSGPKYMRM